MTRDEVIKLVLSRCGNRTKDTYLAGQCVQELALIQQTTLEGADFKPWFLLSEYMHATTGALESRMPLPTNFLEELEEGILWVRPPGQVKYQPLRRDDLDVLEERYLDNEPAMPTNYAIVRQYAVLFPKPDTAYPLKVRCYLREPTLMYEYGQEASQTVKTNQWLTECPDWVVGELGAKIAGSYIKDEATAAKFKEEAMAARTRLYVSTVAREEMNRQRSAGDD